MADLLSSLSIPPETSDLMRTIAGIVLVLVVVFLVMTRAEVILILGVLALLFVLFAQKALRPGTLARATAKRRAAVSENVQPDLGSLIRVSSDIGAGHAIVVGKISGMTRISDIADRTTGAARHLPVNPRKASKPGEKDEKTPGKDGLYQITTEEGWGPNKKHVLFLVRRSDLILPTPDSSIRGDVTVRASGFVPAGMHYVPDTWAQDEVSKMEYSIARTFVMQTVADDVMDDMVSAVEKAKKADPGHQKRLDEVREGVSNPGM